MTQRKRGYQTMTETDAIRRIEEVEGEMAEMVRQHVDDKRTEKLDELRQDLTDARADLVDELLKDELNDDG